MRSAALRWRRLGGHVPNDGVLLPVNQQEVCRLPLLRTCRNSRVHPETCVSCLRGALTARLALTWDFALWEGHSAVSDGVDQILELGRNLRLLPALVIQQEAAR